MASTIPESSEIKRSDNQANLWTRREFMGFAGWGAFLGGIGLGLLGFARFMFPRVLFEPSPLFIAGRPEDYVDGEVSEKYKESNRVWIVREAGRLYAILAICTHLGCTPRWLPLETKFKCPCHGSGYTKDGVNFEGPAPRPLERLRISLNDEGMILVDKSKKYLWEKGEWDDPEAFIML